MINNVTLAFFQHLDDRILGPEQLCPRGPGDQGGGPGDHRRQQAAGRRLPLRHQGGQASVTGNTIRI